jgi:hypothetical protein
MEREGREASGRPSKRTQPPALRYLSCATWIEIVGIVIKSSLHTCELLLFALVLDIRNIYTVSHLQDD